MTLNLFSLKPIQVFLQITPKYTPNATTNLGGSSCMVKITPNAPNLDHAKNSFSQALFFENRILVQRKYLPHHLCHFVPFFGQPKTKKKLN